MNSLLRVGANLLVKVSADGGNSENLIGYCTALQYTVNQGLKTIHVVDSPFPAEIANAGAPMQVTGNMQLIMPKGMTLEAAGLVPYRTGGGASASDTPISTSGNTDTVYAAGAKYMFIRIYDRETGQLVWGCEYCKVNQYSVSIESKQVVRATLSFTGRFLVTGPG